MKKKIKSNTLKERRPNNRKRNLMRDISDNSFYVIGIGASAGGLEALEGFFRNMPENSGMAFIVVSHLDPTRISIMPELLQKSTSMKLLQAKDGMLVKPDHVYVAPPNRDLGILHGTIQLIEPLEAHGFRHPIDFFFKSLSEDSGEKAVSIILSGMGSDGSTGLKAVKSELGMVMVQNPKTAKYDGMPVSAVSTGLADYILPVEEMPVQLIKYTSQKIKGVLLDKAITKLSFRMHFKNLYTA
jgi:chemotaxis response regulator CheB